MTRRIYKYTPIVAEGNIMTVEMPKSAMVLTAGNQNEKLVVWAEVDPEEPTGTRSFSLIATGMEVPSDEEESFYLSTVMFYNGTMVFHVYDNGCV